MTPEAIFQAEAATGTAFEDIIDGYFPLEISIVQMMARHDYAHAVVLLGHAPIMHIPGLPPNDPVPLSIRQGRAGMIDQMVLFVNASTRRLHGQGQWRWLDGTATGDTFDPKTRLAEPAFLRGVIPATPRAPNPTPTIERTKDEHI